MKYGIFRRTVTTNNGIVTIAFASLQNPAGAGQTLLIDAANDPEAANKAHDLLKILGVKTHRTDGNQDTIMADFPNYFVGQFAVELADRYDTERLLYEINTFTPVPKD
jgi:hypothetical protein